MIVSHIVIETFFHKVYCHAQQRGNIFVSFVFFVYILLVIDVHINYGEYIIKDFSFSGEDQLSVTLVTESYVNNSSNAKL